MKVFIPKDNKNLKKSFGMAEKTFKKPTQEIIDSLRKELYDE